MSVVGNPIKKVFFANFVSQIISALIGIIILPFYSRWFSSIDYGIFMIFYMSFSWVLIFDFGFTNYLNKYSTLYKNGKINQAKYNQVLTTYELFFAILITFIIVTLLVGKFYNFQLLSFPILFKEIFFIKVLILVSVLLKLLTILYKASLDGFYLGNIASTLSVSFLAARYLLPLFFQFFINFSLCYFFLYQALISLIEVLFFYSTVRLKSGVKSKFMRSMFDKSHIFNRFTAFSFANAILYLLITQADKLLLVKNLSISEYGEYASIIAVSNGIFYLSGPFMSSISPRLIGSISAGKKSLSNKVLVGSFELTSSIIISVSFWVGLNGILILKIIKPSIAATDALGYTFLFYAVGNGIYSLIGYLNMPQIAYGNMKFNFILSASIAIITILGIYFITPLFGIVGLAIFWFLKNLFLTIASFLLFSKYGNGISFEKPVFILIKKVLINSILLIPFYILTTKFQSTNFLITISLISFISFLTLNYFSSYQVSRYINKLFHKYFP